MNIKRADEVENLFVTALNKKVFKCAAFAFLKKTEMGFDRVVQYYGSTASTGEETELNGNHFFDLASLTKPLVTVLLLLVLFEKKLLDPETRLGDIFSDCPIDKRGISIKQLMSHCAGLAAHREYFLELKKVARESRKEILLHRIFEEKLLVEPGKVHLYSDLGFILLGLIIEKITGRELDKLSRDIIYTPLELQNDLIFPCSLEKHTDSYVSTGKCIGSKKKLCGIVHDDNCRAIGGVAGHAGLFGTLPGVVQICEQLLDQWKGRAQHPAYSNRLLQESFKRVGDSNWTMGFDMVSEQGSSAGKYFSRRSVGHLGFTGTSFWIDPEKDCIAVLLTNRVYYGMENWKIKEFRPVFHDLLMEGI